jgi:hypothetical protein
MCLTLNSAAECAGSTFQVVTVAGAAAVTGDVLMGVAPLSLFDAENQ